MSSTDVFDDTMPPASRMLSLVGAFALSLTLLFTAAACAGHGSIGPSSTAVPPSAGHATGSATVALSGLILPASATIEVSYSTDSGGQFVWRQSGGARRFDVASSSAVVNSGFFFVASDFGAGSQSGSTSVGCSWRAAVDQSMATVDCETGDASNAVVNAVSIVSIADVYASPVARLVHGRDASCYSLSRVGASPLFNDGEVCVDAATRALASLTTRSTSRPELSLALTLEDVSTSTEVPPFLPSQIHLTPIAVGTVLTFHGDVQFAALGLPRAFRLQ